MYRLYRKNDHLWSFFYIIYTFLGSTFEPCCIHNRVITNRVIKRLMCIMFIEGDMLKHEKMYLQNCVPDKSGRLIIFFLFLHKNLCCGYKLEVPLMSTHNIGFYKEMRKILGPSCSKYL